MPKPYHPRAPLTVSIAGPGNLGTALALTLTSAGHAVKFIAVRRKAAVNRDVKILARTIKARLVELGTTPLDTDLVWLAVPDDAIAATALRLAPLQDWHGKIVLHSSGALTSDALAPLRQKGARVASLHPGMTFVRSSVPQMAGVAFALEGDLAATRVARQIVEDLGGTVHTIKKHHKVLYHAFGSFASPLVIALMATLEQVAQAAGIRRQNIKTMMVPLLWQTLHNYLKHDASSAFSGPLARGDVATIRKHLEELEQIPEAREVYVALARAATKTLPVKNRKEVEKALGIRR